MCLLCLSFLPGCFVPYCAYPKLDYTPSIQIDPQPGQVHAFRVDIRKPTADKGVFEGPVYEKLTELPISDENEVASQMKPSFTYGFAVIGVAVNFLTYTTHSVAVRLYQPGYELVEIKSWERTDTIVWTPAKDLEAQEKALDGLYFVWFLDPGSEAERHKQALLFGAGEYDRLATLSTSRELRKKLIQKADALRKRADE
jgi:hypothetical protein